MLFSKMSIQLFLPSQDHGQRQSQAITTRLDGVLHSITVSEHESIHHNLLQQGKKTRKP